MGTKYDNQKIKEKMDNTKSKGKRIDSPTTDDISNIFYKHYPKYQMGELDESWYLFKKSDWKIITKWFS